MDRGNQLHRFQTRPGAGDLRRPIEHEYEYEYEIADPR